MNIIHIGTHVRIVVNYLTIIVIVYVMTGTVSIANKQEKKNLIWRVYRSTTTELHIFQTRFLVNHWVCTDPSSLSKPDFSCDDRMGWEVLGEECRKERLKRWRASPWTRPRGSWNGQCFHKTNPKLGWSVSHRLSKGWFPWKPARSLIETGKKKVKRPFCKIDIKLAYNWLKIETKRLFDGKII